MAIWLAVGDETGSWKLPAPGQPARSILGVVLVIAQIETWRKALNECIDGQTIKQRMLQPLQQLPADVPQRSRLHHVQDAFKYWGAQGQRGCWSLEDPGDEPVRRELFANLRWLAEHREIVTLGIYTEASLVWNRLHRGEDEAQALGQAYASLAALVMPFLEAKDRLILAPSRRSEEPDTLARRRSSAPVSGEPREHGDMRGMITALLHRTRQLVCTWQGKPPGESMAVHLDSGDFTYLRSHYHWGLNLKAIGGIADMGAALMRMTHVSGAVRIKPGDERWPNVRFLHLRTLLS